MSDTLTPAPPATATPEPIPGVRGVVDAPPTAHRLQRRVMLAITTIPLAGLVAAMVLLWGTGISGLDLSLLAGFYVVTGLGVTVGYHRLFTHKSFVAPTPVRVMFGIAGSMAVQGAVIDWVATHRRHHAYSDDLGDPHSPHVDVSEGWRGVVRGLFHAHMGWLFAADGTLAQTWAPDLLRERPIARVSKAFPWLVLASFLLPAVIGGIVSGTVIGAVTGFVWGSLVRIFLLHHVTWSINSICHFYGSRPFESRDESRNNLAMALLGFGEGWHNGHHAFPASARHGLRWWEFDLSWLTIRALRAVRLADNIKVPSTRQLARKLR